MCKTNVTYTETELCLNTHKLEPDLNSSSGVICGKNSSQRYWIIRDKINREIRGVARIFSEVRSTHQFSCPY